MVLLHPNQLALLDRIHQYHQAGWITSDQVRAFNRRVEKKESSDAISRELGQLLRTTATTTKKQKKQPPDPTPRHNGKSISNYDYSATGGGGSKPITTPDDAATIPAATKQKKPPNKKKRTTSTASSSSSGAASRISRNKKSSTTVWEPLEWGQQQAPNDDVLDALFVEMCFFARLLYYQSPCCLACAYQQRTLPTRTCPRWVVWRKNANIALHPDTMQENIVILSCGVASRLLQGEVVSGWKWDGDTKELLRV